MGLVEQSNAVATVLLNLLVLFISPVFQAAANPQHSLASLMSSEISSSRRGIAGRVYLQSMDSNDKSKVASLWSSDLQECKTMPHKLLRSGIFVASGGGGCLSH
ncbi:hypothetical protein FPV67DRAFT_272655 [Lyophyllum atratum]|nr:hypothetical protein FPV67DRAFT_272655 [Lyophyllum atratum]